jgi:chemotaxis protein MotB
MSSAGRARRRAKHHEEEEHENHERWLVSYADMVTLLMCLFIVLFAMSQIDKAKFAALASGLSQSFGAPISALDSNASSQASVLDGLPDPANIAGAVGQPGQVDKAQLDAASAEAAARRAQQLKAEAQNAYSELAAARDKIQAALVAAGYPNAAKYQIDERGLVVHIVADAVLFDAEQANLRPDGSRLLDSVAPTLNGLPNQIRVEGHANRVPVSPNGPWPSNWELSAYRATTVLRHLSGDGIPEARMSAAGYGSTQPLVPYTNPSANTVNRRVDIVVLSNASAEANALLPGLDANTHPGGTP